MKTPLWQVLNEQALEVGRTPGSQARAAVFGTARLGQAMFGDSLVKIGTDNLRYPCTCCVTLAAARVPEHRASPCGAKNPLKWREGKWIW